MSDSDPYLWLEDVTGDKALTWVREHNQPTIDALTTSTRFADLQSGALEVLDTDDRIAYVRRRGEHLYNYWRDAANPRGLWRRTTLEQYRTETPEWDVLIDLDAVASDEDENWVWKGALVLRPDHRRALILLSRGGADASIVREFDMVSRTWITADEGGFTLPENKSDIGWIDEDTVYVGTDFGDQPDGGSALTNSGYPRVVKRWTRGTPLEQAHVVYTGAVEDVAVQAMYDDTIGFERHFLDPVDRLLQPGILRTRRRRDHSHRCPQRCAHERPPELASGLHPVAVAARRTDHLPDRHPAGLRLRRLQERRSRCDGTVLARCAHEPAELLVHVCAPGAGDAADVQTELRLLTSTTGVFPSSQVYRNWRPSACSTPIPITVTNCSCRRAASPRLRACYTARAPDGVAPHQAVARPLRHCECDCLTVLRDLR